MTADTTLLILGASGDLTSRLLLPALGQLLSREPGRRVRLAGAGMEDWSEEQWRDTVRRSFATTDADAAFEAVSATTYTQADITDAAALQQLLDAAEGRPALYFAVPPAVASAACEALRSVRIPEGTILALEKPFGSDAASAERLNATLADLVPETQVFRVDHFLGRSTVLNLLGVRFANRLIEPVWSSDDIASIVVQFDESLGLEGRAGYYDRAGALVDMIQSHLLQVMAFVTMEPPASLDERDLRDATGAVLRATAIWGDDPVASSRRARYTAGTVEGRDFPSYADEPGVDPSRETETLAEMTVEVRNARWQGVPITLRSGKALGHAEAKVEVRFRPVRHLPTGFTGDPAPTVLRFSLGPDSMALELNVNGEADPLELERATLVAELGEGSLKAYAEVLSGILDGDAMLAVRGDAAVDCWHIVQPVLDAWHAGEVPLDEYPAGVAGPAGWPTP
ncbi:glucose-6-phosphate dehydrogenase [Microbacterium sp. EYE_5]|uniref:glucose-6-phosphate dehydrogenase n=1 Tax=unclassified Microbacterium TaxID=2609290 RepID=UPI0020029A95|nr:MULTISPECIES: glucose-6-phosphate dehydrogenase [unclassified Microbacterium]MCK6079339.1 glucose-6-phosphate dehydrogenase [Microbacterium sp. EYE_382]MCK6084609.1 glucose-6-phosphate dehydrogenase [Microbacterium sp. EYE_384]MCK6123162.1 glucose-6-phosphate dehydrogenase [Microbacterium sp. EYE_80]MCK6125373.1 glucose-6-phosphate dehydrogenase [Microbacterium sp. EYE_79]MCK6140293.1 glucose-6-phosphate dehydrogenase [Microbacterium sp. EYE_39]